MKPHCLIRLLLTAMKHEFPFHDPLQMSAESYVCNENILKLKESDREVTELLKVREETTASGLFVSVALSKLWMCW